MPGRGCGQPPHGKSRGFTLMELLVVIAVSGILLAVAVPAFSTFVLSERQNSEVSSLAFSLDFARAEAIKQDNSAGIEVCASSNGSTCTGGTWSQGWIVIPSGGGTPLLVIPALTSGNTLTAVTGTTAATSTTFTPNGLPSVNITFNLCDRRGAAYARYIELGSGGRVYAAPTPGVNASSGAALTCP
jgi:type IV fimbrial biogenesis protein FimT